MKQSERTSGPDPCPSRRSVLLAGLAFAMTGCGKRRATESQSSLLGRTGLPSPAWDARPVPRGNDSVHVPDPEPSIRDYSSPPTFEPTPVPPPTQSNTVLARSRWSNGSPVPTLMRPMAPVVYVTVHHDGMRPFFGTGGREVAARIEAIRRSHRGRGWGDIGYHYVVDRAGRVWEGRPIGYQGAHVKHHNNANIGVVCLGNFDEQAPSDAQLQALDSHLGALMTQYRVPMSRLRTHQEWSATRCPGTSLQRHMNAVRSNLG